jgi:hypothetical protein
LICNLKCANALYPSSVQRVLTTEAPVHSPHLSPLLQMEFVDMNIHVWERSALGNFRVCTDPASCRSLYELPGIGKDLSTIRSFSGSRAQFSVSTVRLRHPRQSASFLTFRTRSTLSRTITTPPGRRMRSISTRMSIIPHLRISLVSKWNSELNFIFNAATYIEWFNCFTVL